MTSPLPTHALDRRLRRLEALLRHLNAARDLPDLLGVLEMQLPLLLDFKHFSLYRFETGRLRLAVSNHLDPVQTPPIPFAPTAGPLWQAVRQERPYSIPEEAGTKRGLAIPLFFEDGLVGVLLLEQPTASDQDLEAIGTKFYEAVGAHIGSALAVRERTAALETALRDLRHAQGELIRSERSAAIGKLASGIAHELKNPLMSMTFAIQNLRDLLGRSDAKPADFFSNLEMLSDDIRRMRDRVHTFLSLARQGQTEEERSPPQLCRPADTIHKVIDRFRSDPRAQGIDLQSLGENQRLVLVDEDQLFAALSNLVVNGLEALSSQRGGTIAIRVDSVEMRVRISVEDDGPGISPDIRERIFDIFFTTKTSGTGLGLSQVFVFAEQHGGRVWLDGTAARGARFVIDLPEARAETKAETKGEARA